MSKNDFLKTQNLQLLWEVLTDDESIKNTNQKTKNELLNAFKINVSPFYKNECNSTQNLLELNKKFIGTMLNHYKKYHINQSINQNISQNNIVQPFFQQNQNAEMYGFSQSQQSQQSQYINKINIHDEPVKKELITFEDLQTHRLTEFETKYAEKEMDFKNAMSLPIPPKPEFSDKIDEPINEIEVEMKKLIAQRNYDVNVLNIQKGENAKNWLQPKETSIKKEHLQLQEKTQNVNKKIYDLQIYEEPQKQVSWKNEIHEIITDNATDNTNNIFNNEITHNDNVNIFSKLKQVKNIEETQSLKHAEKYTQNELYKLEREINELKNEIKNIHSKLDIIIHNINNANNINNVNNVNNINNANITQQAV